MNTKKTSILIFSLIILGLVIYVLSEGWDECKGNAECIEQHTSEREQDNITIGTKTYFLSSIYKDKRNAKHGTNQVRNELFVKNQNTGEIKQLTTDKSYISAMAYSPRTKNIIFAQAQRSDPTFGYIPVINSPGKFGSFKLFSLDLAQDDLKISPLDLEVTLSEIPVMGFDKTGKKLIFQTIYSITSFQVLNIETNNIEKVIPESKLFWWDSKAPADIAMQKIDSEKNNVYFQALDGYVSKENASFVYNEYKMNLDTMIVEKRTHIPSYRPSDKISQEQSSTIEAFQVFSNTSILAPKTNKEVKLVDGKGSYEIVPGSASRGEVTILDKYALWEYGPTVDFSIIIAVNSGGSGTFYYLVLFDVSGDVFTKKSEVLLGDRIKVTDLAIGEMVHSSDALYHVGVNTLERKETDSMADAPTIEKTRIFYVTDQVLEEIEVDPDDT